MSQQKIAVTVSRIEQLTPTIKLFEFAAKDSVFEPFSAGSHITVHMNEERG